VVIRMYVGWVEASTRWSILSTQRWTDPLLKRRYRQTLLGGKRQWVKNECEGNEVPKGVYCPNEEVGGRGRRVKVSWEFGIGVKVQTGKARPCPSEELVCRRRKKCCTKVEVRTSRARFDDLP
jgi:hypothetical protein